MKVFGPEDVGEKSEAAGTARFVERPAGNPACGVGPKHGKAIPGYGGDEEAGRIVVDRGYGGGRAEAQPHLGVINTPGLAERQSLSASQAAEPSLAPPTIWGE